MLKRKFQSHIAVLLIALSFLTGCQQRSEDVGSSNYYLDGSSISNTLPSISPPPPSKFTAHWSIEELTPEYPLVKIEVAGTYEEIGKMFGQWYRDRGYTPRVLTTEEQDAAHALMEFYDSLHPSISDQLRGMYAAYGLNLDDAKEGILIYDLEGTRVLLPGLVERDACSVVFTRPEMSIDGNPRLGRNFDWPIAVPDTTLVFTYPEGGYPTVVMTRITPGLSAADGLNNQGLALGFASVADVGYNPPSGPALVSGFAYRFILEHSANVEEAISLLQSIPITFISSPDEIITHVLIADRNGESAVVEFLPEGVVVSRTDNPFQVMTNSYWAGPSDQKSCWRYRKAVSILEENVGALNADRLMTLMSSIRGDTQWSIIYDLEDLDLTFALPNDQFSHQYKFSLADFVTRIEKR